VHEDDVYAGDSSPMTASSSVAMIGGPCSSSVPVTKGVNLGPQDGQAVKRGRAVAARYSDRGPAGDPNQRQRSASRLARPGPVKISQRKTSA
jgi:hypothetical protein